MSRELKIALWCVAGFIGLGLLVSSDVKPETASSVINPIALGFILLLIYFAPAVVAYRKRQANSVLVLNLFLGWTIVGWVVALAWALMNDQQKVVIVQQQQSSPQAQALLCAICGRYSTGGSVFCSHCGHRFMASV